MKYHFKDYSIQVKLLIGFVIVLAISFTSLLFSTNNSSKIINDTDWIIHTHKVLTSINEIEAKLIDLETGQRGFLITGNPNYLEPYNNSLDILDQKIEFLKQLTSDNKSQTRRIEELKLSVEEKLTELDSTICLRQEIGFDAAKKVVDTDLGKHIMERIRRQLSHIKDEEMRLLAIRSLQPEQSRKRTNMVLYGLLFFTIVSTSFIAYFLSASISKPIKKLKNSTQIVGKGNLEHQIDISSKDEIGELAVSFQNMMKNLQAIMISKDMLQKEIEYRRIVESKLLETRDILVQNETELIKSNLTKDKLFNVLAHDLRSPFNSMIGFMNLLHNNYDKLSKKEITNYIQIIYEGLEDTYELLNNLLIWSKNQKGVLEVNPIMHNLFLLSKNTLEAMLISVKEKSIDLKFKIKPDITAFVDENLYQTILRNLVSNAVKFTPKNGSICIDAELIQNHKNNLDYVKIKVEDNGIGIPDHLKDKLFDIGEKFSTKGTENESGSGLGLSLCKDFVEKSGGKIWFESAGEGGSVFFFTLPVGGKV